MQIKDGQTLTVEYVSPNIMKTPEGYLLCKGVTISKVGTYRYTASEVPGVKDSCGIVQMTRTEEELFSADTMRSFENKPVVIGHDEFADPSNWADVTVGIVSNVRRGVGDQSGDLVADLLITQERGIELVESGELREVSCGYDAETVDDGNGCGRQVGIVGNHVALVSNARCGSTCAIKDGFMDKDKSEIAERCRQAFESGDREGFDDALDELIGSAGAPAEPTEEPIEEPEEHQEDEDPIEEDPVEQEPEQTDGTGHDDIAAKIASLEARLAKLEGQHTDEDPEPETEEPADPDAEPVPDDEAKEIMQDAEECCPGIKKPVADSASGKISRGALKRVMRQCIKNANRPLFGDGSQLDGQALTIAFKAVAQLERSARNPRAKQADSKPADLGINERNAAFWKGR